MTQESHHHVLPDADQWIVTAISWEIEPLKQNQSFIDLSLSRTGEQKVLRFLGPTGIEIKCDQPAFMREISLVISDVTARQLDGLTVQVNSLDSDCNFGGLSFWAQGVEIVLLK